MELPDFSFGITLYEAVNVMILPGLEAFLHFFIRDIILRPYVLPESIVIPLVVRPKPFIAACLALARSKYTSHALTHSCAEVGASQHCVALYPLCLLILFSPFRGAAARRCSQPLSRVPGCRRTGQRQHRRGRWACCSCTWWRPPTSHTSTGAPISASLIPA